MCIRLKEEGKEKEKKKKKRRKEEKKKVKKVKSKEIFFILEHNSFFRPPPLSSWNYAAISIPLLSLHAVPFGFSEKTTFLLLLSFLRLRWSFNC